MVQQESLLDNDEESAVKRSGEVEQMEMKDVNKKLDPRSPAQIRAQELVDSLPVTIIVLLLILADMTLMIYDFVTDAEETWLTVSTLAVVGLLTIEIFIRVFAEGCFDYFKRPFNVFEFTVVVASLVLTAVLIDYSLAPARAARPVLRVARVARFGTKVVRSQERFKFVGRKKVAKNRRQFKQDGFDLDLVYVTDRVIAMSVPAVSIESMYRNPAPEVARFFKTFHPDNYNLYNLASERSYPSSLFHGRVEKWSIDPRSIPPLTGIVKFCIAIDSFLKKDPKNVAAIHCKGGRGRTGLMICCYLQYSGVCSSSQEALDLFQRKRTDESITGKSQGVDLKSYIRYVHYFGRFLNNGSAIPDHKYNLVRVTLKGVPQFNESSMNPPYWTVSMSQASSIGFDVQSKVIGNSTAPDMVKQRVDDSMVWWPALGMPMAGDCRFEFWADDHGEHRMVFYALFHLSFIDNEQIRLSRDDVDKARGVKRSLDKILPESFMLELNFSILE